MDLLIELIVWLFKSLFGEPEKPADMQRRGGERTPARRGPYNYGDGGGRAGGPKTLEQILEEVRREAAQKRGGTPQAPQMAQPVKAAPVPAPKPQTIAERTFKSSLEDRPETLSVPMRSDRPDRVETISTTATVQKLEAIIERQAPSEAAVQMSSEAKQAKKSAPKKKNGRPAPAAAPVAVDVGTSLALIRAIREASPAQKTMAARQAIILTEVFGPPRSRRMHVPGRRMF